MTDRIFPRNLTARAAIRIAGNPVTTRLESGVGNCFPGLEFDHRNLDRRFFPGLVFDFGLAPPVLAAVDGADPALSGPDGSEHSAAVRRRLDVLRAGEWRLASVEQGGRRLDLQALAAPGGGQLDPTLFWRIVRSLEPAPVTIVLAQLRPAVPPPPGAPAAVPATVTLTHVRRRFVDPDSGAISAAYLPGELTQSLCSPWMHDFRDCACDYWASNHPDIALGRDEGLAASGAAQADPAIATRPLDWLRADRGSAVAASASAAVNEAFRLRHYEINSAWASLAFVLEGRENPGTYVQGFEPVAEPFGTPAELADELVMLCGLEQVVMLEYLYAYYSLRHPGDFAGERAADILFVRHELLGVAVSEMRHLRWANQLLWSLAKLGLVPPRPPALTPVARVPGQNGDRDRQLRPLYPEVLQDFIAVERPSGSLDGAYARVVATLRSGYPEPLLQLARQIVADGMEHFGRFREIAVVLGQWAPGAGGAGDWLRPVAVAAGGEAALALSLYQGLLDGLSSAYRNGDAEDAGAILEARQAMMALDLEAERLAALGIGVPFF